MGQLLHGSARTTAALHARIVEVVEALAGDRLAEQVERLAYHALRGEVWDRALEYCQQAGEKARARSAYHEAVAYVEQAIDLRLALRSALLPSNDSGRILAYLRQAETLAMALDDHRRLGHISGYLSVQFRITGAYDQAIAASQRALALAVASGDAVLSALANLRLGAAYGAQGENRRAIECLKQTVTFLHGEQRRERLGQANVLSVQALAFLAMCHAELGMRPLVAHCHLGLGKPYRMLGQREPARAELTTATNLYRAMEMSFWLSQAEVALA